MTSKYIINVFLLNWSLASDFNLALNFLSLKYFDLALIPTLETHKVAYLALLSHSLSVC